MFLEIIYKNGQIERGVSCLAVEWESGVLHIYPNNESWIERKPIHCINVKRYKLWDERIKR